MEFPVFKTKIKGVSGKFDINSPEGRKKYFTAKAGGEIKKIHKYLERDSFIGYMLAKKSAGKGTYARLLGEIFGDKIAHVSVGDIVREIDEEIKDPKKKKELRAFLEANYRGFQSVDEIFKAQKGRSTKGLAHSPQTILALLERKISQLGKKALLIDGFPRDLDQVSYSLFYRHLVGYREDPDFFVLISVPEAVIDERMKYRVVCPKCQLSRNLKLLPTKGIGYEAKTGEFFLKCEDPECQGARMRGKEGDELGIENIRERLVKDEDLMKQAFSLYGIPKILLRNSVPVSQAKRMVDDYELTPEFSYTWDAKGEKVVVGEKPWVIKDDSEVASHSLMAPAVVISFVHQMVEVLGL